MARNMYGARSTGQFHRKLKTWSLLSFISTRLKSYRDLFILLKGGLACSCSKATEGFILTLQDVTLTDLSAVRTSLVLALWNLDSLVQLSAIAMPLNTIASSQPPRFVLFSSASWHSRNCLIDSVTHKEERVLLEVYAGCLSATLIN